MNDATANRPHVQNCGQGVRLERMCNSDTYTGHAAGLVALGLVKAEHLPGAPGMRKHLVTIFPDGKIPGGAATTIWPERRAPGAKLIKRARGGQFTVICWGGHHADAVLRAQARAAAQDACLQRFMAHLVKGWGHG